MIGSMANINSELRNSVAANSRTMCREVRPAGSGVFVISITGLSRRSVDSLLERARSNRVAKASPEGGNRGLRRDSDEVRGAAFRYGQHQSRVARPLTT